MTTENDLGETIETTAGKAKSVTTDGVTVQRHSLPDLIAADKHLKSEANATATGLGIRLSKITPPGAID